MDNAIDGNISGQLNLSLVIGPSVLHPEQGSHPVGFTSSRIRIPAHTERDLDTYGGATPNKQPPRAAPTGITGQTERKGRAVN